MIAKILTLLFWGLCLSGLVVEYPEPWGTYSLWAVIGLSVSHLVECAVFSGRVKAAGGNAAMHYIQLFIFGYFYASTLPSNK